MRVRQRLNISVAGTFVLMGVALVLLFTLDLLLGSTNIAASEIFHSLFGKGSDYSDTPPGLRRLLHIS